MSTTTTNNVTSNTTTTGQRLLDAQGGDYNDRILQALDYASQGKCTQDEANKAVAKYSLEIRAAVMEAKAELDKARDFAARSKCELTRERFITNAVPVAGSIDGRAVEYIPYVFGTGSLGYMAIGKGKIAVDGTECAVQIGTLTLTNSKDLPGFKAGINGKVADGAILVKSEDGKTVNRYGHDNKLAK